MKRTLEENSVTFRDYCTVFDAFSMVFENKNKNKGAGGRGRCALGSHTMVLFVKNRYP